MDRAPEIRREPAEPASLSGPRPRATRADVIRAKASYARGTGVEHVVMAEWLMTWGRRGRKDFGDWLADQDG